jgi:hypothetical protein
VVRGLSAVLAVLGATLAYFLIAPSLSALSSEETAVLVAGACGMVAVGACGLSLAGAWDEPFVLLMVVAGAGIIGACLTDVDAPALENVTKAVAASALGLLIAFALRSPTAFVGVALLVAGIDLWSVLSGPTELLRNSSGSIDVLSFSLPMWGISDSAVEIGVSSLVFLGFYVGSAWRFGFRRAVTGAMLIASLAGAVAVGVELDRAVPAIAALSLAVLVPNLDRIPRALRAERREPPAIRV